MMTDNAQSMRAPLLFARCLTFAAAAAALASTAIAQDAPSPAPATRQGGAVAAAPVVPTDKGAVRGMIEANGVLAYKGIPYAADTGGENRFLPPKPAPAWQTVRDASSRGPACPQGVTNIGDRPQAEDCLRISVWTRSLTGKRPVLVWLHGGGYAIGSDDYTAEGVDGAFAGGSDDYVFASLTHRLNVLGFLQLGPEFGPQYAASGNVGLLDLVAALTWVKENIAQFGGDPDNVTIAGPSGGGSKVMYLTAMPEAKGLFHHGIVFVGGSLLRRTPMDSSIQSGRLVLDRLRIAPGDTRKLQTVPLDDLIAASSALKGGAITLGPVIDRKIVREHPTEAIARGVGREVDLIVSVDQWTHWSPVRALPDPALYGTMSLADLAAALRPTLGDRTDDVIAHYRKIVPGASPSSLAALILTDRLWWIPALRLAEAKAKGGNPARVLFNSASAGAHSYFFGTNLTSPFSRALLGQVQGAYAAFVRSGDPNYPGIPAWPVYTPEARKVLMLEYNVHVKEDPFKAERLVWDDVR